MGGNRKLWLKLQTKIFKAIAPKYSRKYNERIEMMNSESSLVANAPSLANEQLGDRQSLATHIVSRLQATQYA